MAIALGYYPEWEAESSCVIHKPKELILHRFHFIDYKLLNFNFMVWTLKESWFVQGTLTTNRAKCNIDGYQNFKD